VHPSRPVVLAGTGFAAIALMLPFVTLPVVGAVDGWRADAWPTLVALAPATAAALLGHRTRGSGNVVGSVILVTACAALVFAAVKLADSVLSVRGVGGASIGAGAPTLVAGTVVVVAGTVLALRDPSGP